MLRDLGDHDARGFLDRLGERMKVTPDPTPVRPGQPGEIGLLVDGRWYRLSLGEAPTAGAAARMDTERMNREILGPLLGIQDPRNDPRLDFVGGPSSLETLEQRVASGDWAARLHRHGNAPGDDDGGGRRWRRHAAQIHLVRAEAWRRPARQSPRRLRPKSDGPRC